MGSDENSSPEADKPSATVLELYAGRPDANQRFEVSNMLPGDSETKYFCVKAYHDAEIDLFFRADVSEQTKSLGDVLHSKVTHPDTGRVLCDAPFSEIDGQKVSELLTANAEGETTAYYQIDVSLDTSEGNEYQAARLAADFEWYVEDEGGLTPPQTGDTTKLTLWITLAASSLLLILIQGLNSIRLFKRYKKEQLAEIEAQREQEKAELAAERERLEADRLQSQQLMAELQKLKKQLDEKQSGGDPPDTPAV